VNDLDADFASLEDFADFRDECEEKNFRYFWEVFNPNVDTGIAPDKIGDYVNDCIVRTLAGVPRAGRPLFLKIAYNGPRAMEELAAYDSSLVVGILGGSSGTTMDAFKLLHDAKTHGARVALFGRKINLSDHPLSFVQALRLVADGETSPAEAVKFYHSELQKLNITPTRTLNDDIQISDATLMRYA